MKDEKRATRVFRYLHMRGMVETEDQTADEMVREVGRRQWGMHNRYRPTNRAQRMERKNTTGHKREKQGGEKAPMATREGPRTRR